MLWNTEKRSFAFLQSRVEISSTEWTPRPVTQRASLLCCIRHKLAYYPLPHCWSFLRFSSKQWYVTGRLALYQNTEGVHKFKHGFLASVHCLVFVRLHNGCLSLAVQNDAILRNQDQRRPSTRLQTTRPCTMTSAVRHIAAAPCSWMRTPADPVTCFALNTMLQGRDGIWLSWQHRGLTQIFACPGNTHTLKSWPCCLTTGTISMVWNVFCCVKTQTSISGPLSLTFPTREMGLNDFYS